MRIAAAQPIPSAAHSRETMLSAESLAHALNARRNGSGWLAKCPAHDDHHPSLRINERDGKVLIKCWSGCSQEDVIAALKHRGLWGGPLNGAHYSRGASSSDDDIKPKDPMKAWRNAGPFVRDSAAAIYLRGRGLDITDEEACSLRFSPAQWHWPSSSRWPAMVARVALADGTGVTSHMTFLEPDGSGKAPLEKQRLFSAGGRTKGGGVWFGAADPERPFIIAEGVEFSALGAAHLRRHGWMRSAVGGRHLHIDPAAGGAPRARFLRP